MLFYSKNLLGHRLLVWPTLFCLKSFSNQSECLNQTTLNVSFINCWDAVEMVYALQVKLVQTVCGWFEMLIADRSFCFANSYDLKRDLWVKVNDKTCVTRCWNKNWPKFSKSCPKSTLNTFTLKGMFFKKAPEVTEYLSYICEQICCQSLTKIAHSGHTVSSS